jgi:hypothetical protein
MVFKSGENFYNTCTNGTLSDENTTLTEEEKGSATTCEVDPIVDNTDAASTTGGRRRSKKSKKSKKTKKTKKAKKAKKTKKSRKH